MIRSCTVIDCKNSEVKEQIHSHSETAADLSAFKQLQHNEVSNELLQNKFAICYLHLSKNDDTNPHIIDEPLAVESIKIEALPKLVTNNEIPKMSHSYEEDAFINICESNKKLNSQSTTSSNTTDDICVLETHESHYGNQTETHQEQNMHDVKTFDEHFNWRLSPIGMAQDFTLLDAPPTTQNPSRQSVAVDESTEVLLLDSQYNEQGVVFSSTDSDVEVLMSDEAIDSDWSGSAAVFDAIVEAAQPLSSLPHQQQETNLKRNSFSSSAFVRHYGSSTDLDISSVEELTNCGAADVAIKCEQMSRAQLIAVVHEQAARISQLETALQRHNVAQQQLFACLDAVRMEFNSISNGDGAINKHFK